MQGEAAGRAAPLAAKICHIETRELVPTGKTVQFFRDIRYG
jgi:hypothetical protein